MNWTPEEDAELRRQHETGKPFSKIMPFLPGKSRNAIIGRALRLGLTRSKSHGRRIDPEVSAQKREASRIRHMLRKREKRAALRALAPPKPPKVVKVKPVPVERPINDLREFALHLSLLELESHQCRFPYGDGPFTFCGHQRARGESYCAPHVLYCTGVGTPSERSAAPMTETMREAA